MTSTRSIKPRSDRGRRARPPLAARVEEDPRRATPKRASPAPLHTSRAEQRGPDVAARGPAPRGTLPLSVPRRRGRAASLQANERGHRHGWIEAAPPPSNGTLRRPPRRTSPSRPGLPARRPERLRLATVRRRRSEARVRSQVGCRRCLSARPARTKRDSAQSSARAPRVRQQSKCGIVVSVRGSDLARRAPITPALARRGSGWGATSALPQLRRGSSSSVGLVTRSMPWPTAKRLTFTRSPRRASGCDWRRGRRSHWDVPLKLG